MRGSEPPDYKQRSQTPAALREVGAEGRKRWLTSGPPNAIKKSRTNSQLGPSSRPEVQSKISAASAMIIGRCATGNGRGPEKPQLFFLLALGPEWS